VAFHTPVEKSVLVLMVARTVVSANFNRVFGAELAKAVATAR
jgi:hypothetical protein